MVEVGELFITWIQRPNRLLKDVQEGTMISTMAPNSRRILRLPAFQSVTVDMARPANVEVYVEGVYVLNRDPDGI